MPQTAQSSSLFLSNDDAAQSPSLSTLIPRDKLLSNVMHAALRGSETIASLSDAARNGIIQFKEEGDARSALTAADTAAQRIIVSSLLGACPALNIIGEEDESVEVDHDSRRDLRDDLVEGYEWTAPPSGACGEEPPMELDVSRVVVYVDPLDGTREFVEGRLDNVQSLIGVCYDGRPVMGSVGLPFPTNKESATEVVFGMAGRGIGKMRINNDEGSAGIDKCPSPDLKWHCDGDEIRVSSGDSSVVVPAVDLAERIFEAEGGVSRQIAGATGNKLWKVLCGETTLSLLHDKTSLWDTAAPTALLEAVGGRITDYFGEPLVYDPEGEVRNRLCVVASAPGAGGLHDRMVDAMRGDEATVKRLKSS